MIKILEFADKHLDPKWIDQELKCIEKELEIAEQEKINAFVSAGDFFNCNFYASNKSKYSLVIEIIKKYLSIAPLVMIPGTPSHDHEGSYRMLEELGATVIYSPSDYKIINGILFLGFPEINKIHFMKNCKEKNPDKINDLIQSHIHKIIIEQMKPIREMHKDFPCVFLGHGVFIDKKNDNDIIAKNTDIVIYNEILKEINANRYVFGHYHNPQISKVLNGGYVGFSGFDDKPWGSTGFDPGFYITHMEMNGDSLDIFSERHDYPVNRKEKLEVNSIRDCDTLDNFYNLPGADLRVKLKITKEELKKLDLKKEEKKLIESNDLNSCQIIPEIVKQESSRVNTEEFRNIKSLRELYNKFDTEATESELLKVDEIERNVCVKQNSFQKKEVELLSCEIYNSVFSLSEHNKDTLYNDFRNNSPGIIGVTGPNGAGKSTYFGFCSTYPKFIGFDYRTLKDFFPGDGVIRKKFRVNNELHEHKIMIRQSKIECYWYVGSETKLETTSLKEFMEECEKFFGPFDTYVPTYMMVQEPHRMKNIVGSICDASKIDLRNTYMKIVGIDRTREKEYAKTRRDIINLSLESLKTRAGIYKNDIENYNPEFIDEDYIEQLEKRIGLLGETIKIKNKDLESLQKDYEKQREIQTKIKIVESHLESLKKNKIEIEEFIYNFDVDIESIESKLKDNDNIKKEIESLREIYHETDNKLISNKEQLQIKIQSTSIETSTLNSLIRENEILNKPCKKCGYIDEEQNKKINDNKIRIENCKYIIKKNEESLTNYRKNIADIENERENIEAKAYREKEKILSLKEEQELNEKVKYSFNIKDKKNQLKNIAEKIELKEKEKSELNDPLLLELFLSNDIDKLKSEIKEDTENINKLNNELYKLKGAMEEKRKRSKEISDKKKDLEKIEKEIGELNIEFVQWEKIETNFQQNKIPALELDIAAKEIDAIANSLLDGKFSIETETQLINKKGEIVDKFDIIVNYHETGYSKSLIDHSSGQKRWLNEALSQAFKKYRERKTGIKFLWSFSDEIDGPIQYDEIQRFYSIIQNSLEPGEKRYIVTHSPEAESYIQEKINIMEVIK